MNDIDFLEERINELEERVDYLKTIDFLEERINELEDRIDYEKSPLFFSRCF